MTFFVKVLFMKNRYLFIIKFSLTQSDNRDLGVLFILETSWFFVSREICFKLKLYAHFNTIPFQKILGTVKF